MSAMGRPFGRASATPQTPKPRQHIFELGHLLDRILYWGFGTESHYRRDDRTVVPALIEKIVLPGFGNGVSCPSSTHCPRRITMERPQRSCVLVIPGRPQSAPELEEEIQGHGSNDTHGQPRAGNDQKARTRVFHGVGASDLGQTTVELAVNLHV